MNAVAEPVLGTVVITNTGTKRRTQWVEIGVPASMFDAPIRIQGRGGSTPCYPGRKLPDVRFFHARVSVPPQSLSQFDIVHDTDKRDLTTAVMHPFVGDDVLDLLTSFDVTDANGTVRTLTPADMLFQPLEMSPARNVYNLSGFVPGTPVHVNVNAYVWHQQAHVRLEVQVGMGGVSIGRDVVSYPVQSIVMKCGEAVLFDHRKRCGVSEPARGRDGKWAVLLSGPRSLGRGELLPFFGWMLCLSNKLGVVASDFAAVVENMQGIADGGHVAATFEQWDGHYSTQGVVPRAVPGLDSAAANAAAAAHQAAMQFRGDMYDQRPLGSPKYSGTTGEQEDFGEVQDVRALRLADPRRQDELQFSAHGYFLRPFHNREDNSRPMRFGDHPQCRTWSQIPERRVGSGDSLGWPPNLPASWGRSGYTGMDDQHRSQEIITCWAHLVDSWAITQLLYDFVQTDLGQAKVYQETSDTPRAEGRCLSAWADMLGLLAGEDLRVQLTRHGDRRLNVLASHWVGRNLPNDRVRPLYIGNSPDLQNHATPAVVVWEHCIAAMGFYDWWQRTGSVVAMDLCLATCDMIVRFGTFMHEGQWCCVQAMRWQDGGVPLPAESYGPWTDAVKADSGNWWTWSLPPVLILAHEWPDHELAPKARAILADVYGAGPRTEKQAEWWAVVPHREWRPVSLLLGPTITESVDLSATPEPAPASSTEATTEPVAEDASASDVPPAEQVPAGESGVQPS